MGSMQHSARTHLALKTRAKNARWVRSVGTPPLARFSPSAVKQIGSPGKHCRINALDGVASTPLRSPRLSGVEAAILSIHIVQYPDAAGTVFHRQHKFVLGQRKFDEVNLIWDHQARVR